MPLNPEFCPGFGKPGPRIMDPGIPVLILFGPTASGKTALLEELFYQSPSGTAEIISADSMQVYRGMDIGTAKPGAEERAKIPHHLIDILDPSEQFNAGEFVRLAEDAISLAASHNALPVVSGGTGFYLKNLILGLPASPPSDPVIRLELKEELARSGAASLMKELAASDPLSAARIHLNDEYRLMRALEVLRLTGRPLSSYAQNNGPYGKKSGFRFLVLGLKREREELYRRINERCTAMFNSGLPDEVKRLFDSGYTPKDPGLRAIGYREFFAEDPGIGPDTEPVYRLSADTAGVENLVAQNSRRYAKRQLTFFASIPGVTWIEAQDIKKAADKIRRELEEFLDHSAQPVPLARNF